MHIYIHMDSIVIDARVAAKTDAAHQPVAIGATSFCGAAVATTTLHLQCESDMPICVQINWRSTCYEKVHLPRLLAARVHPPVQRAVVAHAIAIGLGCGPADKILFLEPEKEKARNLVRNQHDASSTTGLVFCSNTKLFLPGKNTGS